MQNKKKLVVIAIASVAIGAVMFTSQAKAASSSWKEYFSENEANSLKKYVAEYIREQLKNNNKDWKGVISAKELDNGTINADKVDNTIAKKKIYTGSVTCDKSFATKTTAPAGDPDELSFYKKIEIPEIRLSDAPMVTLLTKKPSDSVFTQLASDIWSSNDAVISEGALWLDFANEDNGTGFACFVSDYKIIVTY